MSDRFHRAHVWAVWSRAEYLKILRLTQSYYNQMQPLWATYLQKNEKNFAGLRSAPDPILNAHEVAVSRPHPPRSTDAVGACEDVRMQCETRRVILKRKDRTKKTVTNPW